MSRIVTPAARETMREGAAEVREKLKADLSRWTRVRRFATLSRTMGCQPCDATGKVACATCSGSGKSHMVLNETQEDCPTCAGTGRVTCVDCAGAGYVPNTNRKWILRLLVVGGLAWLVVLYVLWGGDVLPEQRSHGGGRAAAPATGGGRVGTPGGMPGAGGVPGGYGQPSGGPMAPSGGYAQPPGGMRGQPSGMYVPGGGGQIGTPPGGAMRYGR